MTVPGRVASGTLRLAGRYAERYVRRRTARALSPAGPPRAALVALGVSIAALISTAALGPSAAVEPLPGHPPFGAAAHPPSALVTALLGVTVITGAYGVLGCLDALRRGWALQVRWLLGASMLVAVVLGLLAPVGSSDPGSYAAYGRLAATGHDPYATAPTALTGPYRDLAEEPWRTTPSVYGPIATGEQWLAAKIAGDGRHAPAHAVFLLGIVNALAFIAAGLLLQRLAAGQAGRRRAAVLFSANPLLLFEGVAGAHLDVVVTFFAVGAIAVFRRVRLPAQLGAFAAGVLGGVAAALKASAGLVGLGLAWAAGSERQAAKPRLAALALGAAAVLLPSYLLAGPHVFDQLRHASNFVSFADPWRVVTHPLESLFGHDAARAFIKTCSWIAFAVFVVLLNRGLPGRRAAGLGGVLIEPGIAVAGDPGIAATRNALVLVFAWLLTATYVLPWYAFVAFALLALLPPSGFDRLLVFWTTVLALAYLPGRSAVTLPGWLHDTVNGWKSGFAPVLLLCLSLASAVMCVRARA